MLIAGLRAGFGAAPRRLAVGERPHQSRPVLDQRPHGTLVGRGQERLQELLAAYGLGPGIGRIRFRQAKLAQQPPRHVLPLPCGFLRPELLHLLPQPVQLGTITGGNRDNRGSNSLFLRFLCFLMFRSVIPIAARHLSVWER